MVYQKRMCTVLYMGSPLKGVNRQDWYLLYIMIQEPISKIEAAKNTIQ